MFLLPIESVGSECPNIAFSRPQSDLVLSASSGRPLSALLGHTGPIRGSLEADIGETHGHESCPEAVSRCSSQS